jgi:tetratricopeptide (TPR) repeat protein
MVSAPGENTNGERSNKTRFSRGAGRRDSLISFYCVSALLLAIQQVSIPPQSDGQPAVDQLQSSLGQQENPNAPEAAQVNSYIQQAGSRAGQQDLRGTVEQGQALLNQHSFAPAHFFLGYALAQSGQYQQAIAEFQTSLQLDPTQKEAVLNIGSNYQSMGDCANAITWYERYLSDFPGSSKSSDIQSRIRGLKQQLAKQSNNGGRPAPSAANPPQTFANGGSSFPSPANNFPAGSGAFPQSPQNLTAGGASFQPSTMNGAAFPQAQDDYFVNASSDGRYYRWGRMPIRVCIVFGGNVAGYRDSYYQDLSDSFNKWAAASANRLAFTPVQSPAQANIVCDWTSGPNHLVAPGRPVEGGLTKLSGQPQANGDVIISNAHITILTNRSGQSLSDDDMKKVCLHEIGHAIGINGHSNSNSDIMFFSEAPTIWPALTKRDKATICHLYANYPVPGSNSQ